MTDQDLLAKRFEEQRTQLRAVAYRMLGSFSEADDAVQEAWIRLSRIDAGEIENLGGWLTTVVSRVCLDMLRSRKSRREESLDVHLPDLVVSSAEGLDPEQETLLADAVGVALLVVLEQLAPAERLAFVLHDMFAVPFDEVATILGREQAAVRQLASRGRRRVQDAGPTPDADRGRQRELADAFLAASRGGSREALLAVLDPDVVLRVDSGAGGVGPAASKVVRGADAVVAQALLFAAAAIYARPALVNGAPGLVNVRGGRAEAVMGFTVRAGRIVEIYILADPGRLGAVDVSALS